MASQFHSSEAEVLMRENEVSKHELVSTPYEDLGDCYEIKKCADHIKKFACCKVALQFPDYLLPDAVGVVRLLQEACEAEVFLLADTSYGNYDVDEVAAEHIEADLIIHYGKSAFTSTAKTNTLFIFGKNLINVDYAASCCKDLNPNLEQVLVLMDLNCHHAAENLREALSLRNVPATIADIAQSQINLKPVNDDDFCKNNCPDCDCRSSSEHLITTGTSEYIEDMDFVQLSPRVDIADQQVSVLDSCSQQPSFQTGFYRIPIERSSLHNYSLFFVGCKESETLTNFLIQHPQLNGHVFDIRTQVSSPLPTTINRTLKRRYYVVEKLRDARTIGILVGTMGMSGYAAIISQLKNMIKLSGRKSYTFVVGKLNPAKLANFPEMDAFVLVACPEQAFVDSPSDYFKPIATPYELEVALNSNRTWNGDYVTDFRELLPGGKRFVEFAASDTCDVSLVTGDVRSAAIVDAMTPDSSSSAGNIALRNQQTALNVFHPHAAARHYAERSWQGLEQKLGETPVSTVTPGRSGVPVSYVNIES